MFYNSNSSLIYLNTYGYLPNKCRSKVEFTKPSWWKIQDSHWIQTEAELYSFVTCYSKNSITFDFYITPFQPELWYTLLATYFCLTIILSFWMLKKLQGSFCSWLFVLGALLEDGVPLPRKLEKNSAFRLIFGCWIIVCVFITNCYNGLMITGLNSPLAATTVNTFKDLVCDWQDFTLTYKEYMNMSNDTKTKQVLNAIHLYSVSIKWYGSVQKWYGIEEFSLAVFYDEATVAINRTGNPDISTSNECFSLLSQWQ